jgi:uncharacterized protein (TIGR02186 family)
VNGRFVKAVAFAGALTLGIVFIAGFAPVRAQEESTLVADLSENLIAITTGFSGIDVLLFGATDGYGEVIVVVRGPTDSVTVRKKERVAGIWVNTSSLEFDGVPGYYRFAASQPVDTLLTKELRQTFQIGDRNIAVAPLETRSPAIEKDFFDALIRNKQRASLYDAEQGTVKFLGNRLFRTQISLPANVPTGKYSVEVFLVSDGIIVNRTTTPLVVVKSGFEEQVYTFAHEQAALYGLIAIVIALVAGWFAGYVFRKI